MHVLRGSRQLVDRFVVWVLRLGADPDDSHDERAQKAFLVAVTVGVLPAGIVWGALYWVLGERTAALFPWGYTVLSVLCLVVFARNRSFAFLRTAELSMILVTPAFLLLALGGLIASSGVILWSFLAPLGAAVFHRPDRAWRWYAAFVALLAVTIPLAPVVRPDDADMPYPAVLAFGALNIAAVTLVTFVVILAFARQRAAAQGRVETLLLNILPEEIAERLQMEPQTIADHFDEASVLFADVVDFTPLSSRLDARAVLTRELDRGRDHLLADDPELHRHEDAAEVRHGHRLQLVRRRHALREPFAVRAAHGHVDDEADEEPCRAD